MRIHRKTLLAFTLTALLAGCDQGASLDPAKQVGPNPELPKAQNFLMPPMQVRRGGVERGRDAKSGAGAED